MNIRGLLGIALAGLLALGMVNAPPVAVASPQEDDDALTAEGVDADSVTQGELRVKRQDGTALGACALEHTDVSAKISGFLARVDVTQRFANPYREKIDAVYVLPLPQNAAVDRMRLQVGRRTIEGKIARREEARRIYEEARESGYVASLLDQERPNIFTQSVANILPGQRIEVTISYLEVLPYEDGSYQFVFPMVVGPRYIPGTPVVASEEKGPSTGGGESPDTDEVPDASRITPPMTPEGTRAGHDVSLKVTLDAGVPIMDMKSALHDVDVQRTSDHSATVRLVDDEVIPNRDFVLTYAVANRELEDAVLAHRGANGGFFTLILQPPDRVATEDVSPKELVFVIDTSGSMDGFPIEKAKECVNLALDGLYPDDTFNLITFAGDTDVLFPEPVSATPENLKRARAFLEGRGGSGGTEMMTAIRAALEPSDRQDHLRIVCFMTDGYVGNDMEILSEIQKHQNARVFSFGIGNSVNRFLLDKMAEEGRGAAEFVSLQDDGSAAARRFHERVRNPLLTDVSIDWAGLRVSDTYPRRIPDVFSATPVVVCGRYDRGQTGTIVVRGKAGGREITRRVDVRFPDREPENDVLGPLWARMRIDDLMSQDFSGIQRGAPKKGVFDEITDLGLKFSLLTQFTSFVAVDDSVSTGKKAQKRVDVPTELPDGTNRTGLGSSGNNLVSTQKAATATTTKPSGKITGRVSDASGAVVPGAVVKLVSDVDGTEVETTTDASGLFSFDGVGTGTYSMKVESSGFKTTVLTGVSLSLAKPLDVQLEAANVSEVVTIVAGESLAINGARVMNLPLSGRSLVSFARLTPGVLGPGTGEGESGSSRGAGRYSWHADDPRLKLDAALAGLPADAAIDVQVWVAAKSPELLAKLRALGFEVVRDVKGRNRLVGRLPAKSLSALASLAEVRYVAKA